MLTTRVTYLTGEPKAGKSLWAVGAVIAGVEGHSHFVGQRLLRPLRHVVWGFTDDGSDSELRERLEGTKAMASVSVLPVHDLTEDDWAKLPAVLATTGCDLFVLDTVLGSLAPGQDIASSLTAASVNVRLRRFPEAGIPVLAITHTPKGSSEGLTVPSSVIGGRAMAAGGRGVIALRRRGDGGRRIVTNLNRAREDLDLRVKVEPITEGSEVPRWTLLEHGKPSGTEWHRNLVDLVVAEQPDTSSATELGRLYSSRLSKSERTVRQAVPDLLEHDGASWRALAA